ncbi:GTPase Era [Campylobacter sp. 19-13652]|uniref:GTPase Era n=1 Tax=Campylobacter sp. 19-13652 TaxID=2840180 RepID=UPI001C77E82F|nr:GTPase Era [Campylobacter sp. 19-13652]BCX79820.1 GTPase Era [Campylobacter sp. 19-13652]
MRSGFVSVVGRPNAGKSSLLNCLLNEKIAITSHKQNATRRKINAIVMHEGDQIIFIDTPGLHESGKMLNQLMVEAAKKAISECDLILFLAPASDDVSDYEKFLALKPKHPHILVLSKVDKLSNAEILKAIEKYAKFSDKFIALLPFSVKKQGYKNELLSTIAKALPQHEYYYDPEFITTTNEREIFRDFILEALYENLSDELPYSCDAVVKKVVEKPNITEVYANIIAEREAHRPLIIGKNGECIKRIGITARKLISNLTQKKVFLKLELFVKKGWSKDEKLVRKLNRYDE